MAGKERVDFTSRYSVGDQIWVSHEIEAFVCGRVETVTQTRMEVKVEGQLDNLKFIANTKDPMPIFEPCGNHIRDEVDNLVDLDELSEAAILFHVRKRFKKKLIYTHVGSILVAINPFERLDIYGPKDIARAQKDFYPHVYCTAAVAYKQLVENQKNQSVLISGESGAGKTETTKKVLSYLAIVAKAPPSKSSKATEDNVTIEDKILQSNPLLEALGNAKTLRNNNSSRFGKYMRVDFDPNYKISGCEIMNYLLEKSRVVVQTDKERNYHIFYQLIVGLDPALKSKFFLKDDVMHYNYLNQTGCTEIPGVDDKAELADVLQAMKTLQFAPTLQNDILTTIAAVLQLGNIEFEESNNRDSCVISPASATTMKNVSVLLGVELNSLSFSLTDKLVSMGRASVVGIKLNINQALDGRDSLAKALYSNMFDYIIAQINTTLKLSDSTAKTSGSIGILDIFGFEIFQINSFEQLCINYANEKLQHHFNDVIFNEERQMYEFEGISAAEIKFDDNSQCVSLVEGRPYGILSLLDEECSLGNATDFTFLSKLDKSFGSGKPQTNAYFIKHKTKPNVFSIKHFAGPVDYYVDSFLDKNRDTISKTTMDMICCSKISLIRSIFEVKQAAKTAADDKGSSKNISLGGQFRGQLINLITTVRATEPHFIRCVKPNELKQGGFLDGNMTLRQLRYAGLFEAIRIRKSGYSYRASHDVFANLYRLILRESVLVKSKKMSSSEVCNEILKEVDTRDILPKGVFFLGTTKVFLKSTSHKTLLERAKAGKISKFVINIQKTIRMFLAKVVAFKLRYEKTKVQEAEKKIKMRFHDAAKVIQKYYRGMSIRLAMEQLGNFIDLRRYLIKRDMVSIKSFVTQIDKTLFKRRSSTSPKKGKLRNGDDEADEKSGNTQNKTPRQFASERMNAGLTHEVFIAKAFIKLFDMQHFFLDSLNKAIQYGDVIKINELVMKCEKVDLGKHETVVRAKKELQVIFSKKVIIERLLYFLKYNSFSSNVVDLPFSKSTQFYDIEQIIANIPKDIAEARRLEVDEDFISKVEAIYNNILPRMGLRSTFRKSLMTVDVARIAQCLSDLASLSGLIDHMQLSNAQFELKTLVGGKESEAADDAALKDYEDSVHTMLQLIDNLPRKSSDSTEAVFRNPAVALGSQLLFLEKEIRASRSLFTFLHAERLFECESKTELNDGGGGGGGGNRYAARLDDTLIGLCSAIARSQDSKRTTELSVLLSKKCGDDMIFYEKVIRTFKWSNLITMSWQEHSPREFDAISSGSFFGYNSIDAKNSPYVKSHILNEELTVNPVYKDASPKNEKLMKSDEINLPLSIVTTIRSCNNLDLSGNEEKPVASPRKSVNDGRGSLYATPKKKATPSSIRNTKTPVSASSSPMPMSGFQSPQMTSSTPSTPSTQERQFRTLSPPTKARLDTGIGSLGSEARSPKPSPRSPADIHKYRPKANSFLSPHKQLYDDFVYEKSAESQEEKEQHSKLLASRQTLDVIKKDMKTALSKMNLYINTANKTGWK